MITPRSSIPNAREVCKAFLRELDENLPRGAQFCLAAPLRRQELMMAMLLCWLSDRLSFVEESGGRIEDTDRRVQRAWEKICATAGTPADITPESLHRAVTEHQSEILDAFTDLMWDWPGSGADEIPKH